MTVIDVYNIGKETTERKISVGDCFISDGGRIVMVCGDKNLRYRLVAIGSKDDRMSVGKFWNAETYKSLEELTKYVYSAGFRKYVKSMEIKISEVEGI